MGRLESNQLDLSSLRGGERWTISTNQKTLSKVESLVHVEPVGQLQLKGFPHPVSAFNIVGPKTCLLILRDEFDSGLCRR